jgi:protein-S-isoprenylcysteine O-methyltransferase Ste14
MTVGEGVGLTIRNVLFTLLVPGLGAVIGPWLVLSGGGLLPTPSSWYPAVAVVAGLALYLDCVWAFATVGRGTPGPWDAPRRVVTVGPYRWVRNPIYLAALLVVSGEAWLFRSATLLVYVAAMAACFHVFVIGYEEPALRRTFGDDYRQYVATVPRWLPRRPRHTP